MKHLASILLLGILVFNWTGYQLFTAYMENRADVKLEVQLDNDRFDESLLVSVKLPFTHLSYYTNSNSFERVDGQVEINGVPYKYVKRRLFNDSVELLCIPNESAVQFQNAKDEFFKLVNGLQHTGQGKKADSRTAYSKNFSTDAYTLHEALVMNELYYRVSERALMDESKCIPVYTLPAEQPPDCIS